ncbi:MAG: IS1634 family transposase [Nocardioidaceae bacterium]
MAWIRRVRTASGATAVQIAEHVDGRRKIVAHLGSAHTDAELGALLERARLLLHDAGQDELDLGVEPTPAKVDLLAPPRVEDALFADAVAGEPVGRPAGRRRVSAPRVVRTSSRLLFDTLAGVYADLGFGVVGDETFRDLVIARIVEPTSILDVGRVLDDLGQQPASEKTMRRTTARCVGRGYRDEIASACFTQVLAAGDVSLVLYDVTTLYFEAEKEDDLRKVGYSKEHRVDPQIVVGLLVDRLGFPLEIGCYQGNKPETATIIPIVEQFAQRHALADMVVVADAGMLSAANLRELDEAQPRFIVGSRVTKAPIDLASHFRWHGDAFNDGQVIDTLTPKTARVLENDVNLKAEPTWDPAQHRESWRAVWAYSAKRAVRDNKTLTMQESRATEVIAGEKTARTPRFVKTSNGTKTLDEASLARARRLVGLKGYVTNIPDHVMPAGEVIASYHDLWRVEQSFRMSKTDLRARPMFVRTQDAIEAHLTVVFTALAVSREVQHRTGLAIRNVIRQLRPLRSATILSNGAQQSIPPAVPDEQQALLDQLAARNVRH